MKSRLTRKLGLLATAAGLVALAFTGTTASAAAPAKVESQVQTQPGVLATTGPFQLISQRSGFCVAPVVAAITDGSAMIQENCWWEPNAHKWYLDELAPGLYRVRNLRSDPNRPKCLDVWGHNNAGTSFLWDCHGGVQQQWFLTHTGNGWYEIKSKQSNRCLDTNVFTVPGTPVWQWDCNGQSQQRFRLG